jgi:hypothetical protein
LLEIRKYAVAGITILMTNNKNGKLKGLMKDFMKISIFKIVL